MIRNRIYNFLIAVHWFSQILLQISLSNFYYSSSDSSFKSSSSPSNHFNLSDMESHKPLKREPPPRPPPPRFLHNNNHIQLKSMHQMKSQTLVNETRQSVSLPKNDFTKSFAKLNRIKSEKDAGVISSVYGETCSLTHARRKTCPSTDSLTASSPPPLPPRPHLPSLDWVSNSFLFVTFFLPSIFIQIN